MNWQDFIFGKKTLQNNAQAPQAQAPQQPQQFQGNAGFDMKKMAQDQANRVKLTAMGGPAGQIADAFHHPSVGAPQPTMQQLCPTCGK